MGRIYRIEKENQSVSAAQDLLEIKGATGKIFYVRRVWWKDVDSSLPTSQMLRTNCTFLGATVTDGSGGGSVTPAKTDQGDPAASITALYGSTTQASSSTTVSIEVSGDHIYNGYEKRFDQGDMPPIGPSEAFVFGLLAAPSGTIHLSYGALVEEIGG